MDIFSFPWKTPMAPSEEQINLHHLSSVAKGPNTQAGSHPLYCFNLASIHLQNMQISQVLEREGGPKNIQDATQEQIQEGTGNIVDDSKILII